jgi:hypothetical protein
MRKAKRKITLLPMYSAPIPSLRSPEQTRIPKRQKRSRTLRPRQCLYGAFAGTGKTLVMPNAIEDPREEAGVWAGARVLRVEIDVLVSRVSGGRVMTGLGSVNLKQHGQVSCIPREANKRTRSRRVVSRVDVERAKHGRNIYGLMR